MDARSMDRWEGMLLEAQVEAEMLESIPERLVKFVEPFTRSILQAKQRRRAAEFIGGLISGGERKDAESVSSRHDQERDGREDFLGGSGREQQRLRCGHR